MPEEATVGETIESLRSLDEDHEPVQYVYTINHYGTLTGVLSMRTLVLASNDKVLSDLAFTDLITTSPDTDQEEVAGDISKYNILAMPVVDETGKLLGIVTVDDALDVLEEEHDEDLAIAGAAMGDTAGGPVIDFIKLFISRELWLIVWAAAALGIVLLGGFSFFAGSLILMPIVLVIAGDVASFAISSLIEYEGDKELSLGSMLGRDFIVSLLIAIFCGLLIGIIDGVMAGQQTGTVAAALTRALPAVVITVVIMVTSGALLSRFAKHQHDHGKLVSQGRLAFFIMVLGAAIQLLLTYALGLMPAM